MGKRNSIYFDNLKIKATFIRAQNKQLYFILPKSKVRILKQNVRSMALVYTAKSSKQQFDSVSVVIYRLNYIK